MGGTDRLRVEANERADLEDFLFAVDESLNDGFQHIGAQLLTHPSKNRAWVIDGFAPDSPSGTQVRVTKGRAILSRIEEGVISHGMITSVGDATKIIDISSFSDNTYGIFIRFQYVDGDQESRAFWDSSALKEFAQTIATRRNANWSMRIEATNPGSEWFKIGQVIVLAGVISTAAGGLVDLRNFYFEGQRNADIAPATPALNGTQYESDWSPDGDPDGTGQSKGGALTAGTYDWPGGSGSTAVVTVTAGVTAEVAVNDFIRQRPDRRWYKIISIIADTSVTVEDVFSHGGTYPTGVGTSTQRAEDRDATRQDDGSKDLQTFTAAVRQSIEDIKGRGLRRWWDRDIGGMNIGFDDQPTEKRIALGDVDFFIDHGTPSPTSVPFIAFDTSANAIRYDRATNEFQFRIASISEVGVQATGMFILDGLAVGHAIIPGTDIISVGDAQFNLDFNGGNPRIQFAGATAALRDEFVYNRTANRWEWKIGDGAASIVELQLDAVGLGITNGLRVGFTGPPVGLLRVEIADVDFYIENTGDPLLHFDTDDEIIYNRASNKWDFDIGVGVTVAVINEDAVWADQGRFIGTTLEDPSSDEELSTRNAINAVTGRVRVAGQGAAAPIYAVSGSVSTSWNFNTAIAPGRVGGIGSYQFTLDHRLDSVTANVHVGQFIGNTGGPYLIEAGFSNTGVTVDLLVYDTSGVLKDLVLNDLIFITIIGDVRSGGAALSLP